MNQVEVRRRQIQMGSYMLGLLSIWILGRRIGDNGIAFLATALEAMWLLWCVTGAYASDVLGKVLRSRNARSQYKNADKLRRNSMILFLGIGFAASVLLFALSGFVAEQIFRMPYSRFLMVLLAPALLFRAVSAVLLGYFQGNGSELPTAIASVLRQVFFLSFALFFSSSLGGYGSKVSALLGQEAFTAMYGGVGVVVAILLTELLIMLFLFLIYKGNGRSKNKRDVEGMKATDSFVGHVCLLYRNMGGKILLGLLEGLPLWFGLIFYQKSVADVNASADDYGIYFGKYLVLCGIIILINAITIIAINAKTAVYVRKDEARFAKHMFQSGLRIVVIHTLFFAVFVAIMAKQLSGILSGSEQVLLSAMFSYGSVLIVTVSLAFFLSRLLLLLGMDLWVYGCAGIGDVIFMIVAVLLLNTGKQGVMSLIYGAVLGSGIYAVLAGILVCRQLRVGLDAIRTLAIPAGSACLTGLLCLLLSKAFTPHLGNLVTVIVCLILGSILYLVSVLLLRTFRENELEDVPGGRIFRVVGQLLRVL